MKITFERRKAAIAFSSMAEGMSEVQRDDDEVTLADQMDTVSALVSVAIDQTEGERIVVQMDDSLKDVAEQIAENCLDNTSGRQWFADMDEDESDDCYLNDLAIE
jgi:urease accessory protein UreF